MRGTISVVSAFRRTISVVSAFRRTHCWRGRLRVTTDTEPIRLPAVPDEELVSRIRTGDLRLFEELMRRYNQRLYRVARAIVKDEDEAEDVMQQAYINAFQHLAQFAERASFATWLTRIAVHEALARRRR